MQSVQWGISASLQGTHAKIELDSRPAGTNRCEVHLQRMSSILAGLMSLCPNEPDDFLDFSSGECKLSDQDMHSKATLLQNHRCRWRDTCAGNHTLWEPDALLSFPPSAPLPPAQASSHHGIASWHVILHMNRCNIATFNIATCTCIIIDQALQGRST